MGKNDQDNNKGEFVIKNAKRELKWKIWKLGPNQKSGKNGDFQNEILLVNKNGFITRITISFLSNFHGSKDLFWWIFQWIMEVWA